MKNNNDKDGLPSHLNESTEDISRVQRIENILKQWEKLGGTARAFAQAYNENLAEGEKRLHHQTLLRWKKKYSGRTKSLYRKPRTTPEPKKAALSQAKSGEDRQMEFVLGFIGSTLIDKTKVDTKCVDNLLNGASHVSLARAHKLMVKVSPFAAWGEPMSIHRAYRRWQAILPAYRTIIAKSNKQHYDSLMIHLPKPKRAAHEEWQMDELEFKVLGFDRNTGEKKVITIYCVCCVDTATGFVRHIEVSESRITKLVFLRAMKRSLRGNRAMGASCCVRPVSIRMDGASIHEKKESLNPHKVMDVHMSASALNFALIHNKPHSPRMDAVVENFNGNFKDVLVLEFTMFVQRIAPPMNTTEWVTHLLALREQIDAFGREWNTAPQRDGTSRLQKVETTLHPGTLDITEDEIDRGVRHTFSRPFNEAIVIDGETYYNPNMFFRQRRHILVRVRPDGPGADVEAYSRGEHIGTLYRVKDHPLMAQGMNSTCKAFIAEQIVIGQQRSLRFCDLFEQLVLEGKIGTPLQQQIVKAKRGVTALPEVPPIPSAETTSAELVEASADWAGGSL